MSLSKPTERQAPRPKCCRCRHHGIIVPQKGHGKSCPFLKCECCRCNLIRQRTELTAMLRNLRKAPNKPQNTEQRPGATTVEKRAAEESFSIPAPDGGARRSVTSPPLTKLPMDGAWYPTDLHGRPAGREREAAAASDGGRVLLTSSEQESSNVTPSNAPHSIEFGQTALPVIPFPFRMPAQCPSTFVPCANFLLNMPGFVPLSPGPYNDGLCGPLVFPHFQSGAPHHPPPSQPRPPADCRAVFFPLQPLPLLEAVQEEQTSRLDLKHPLSNKETIVELD